MNTGITIKGNALGAAAIQRTEHTPPASFEEITYGEDNSEPMVLKMVLYATPELRPAAIPDSLLRLVLQTDYDISETEFVSALS